jgi:serine/threonine protein kinase
VLLEWTEGFSLLDLLRSRQEIDADEALLLLRQIAAGVDEAIARGFRHLDFSLSQVHVHFPEREQEPDRFMATPVDRWPQFLVKINSLGITREFSTSDTWAGGQTIVGDLAAAPRRDPSGAPARHYIQSLAAVVYDLLGGTLSPVMIGGLGTQPAPRYVPVAALSEAGNEVLKRALDAKRSKWRWRGITAPRSHRLRRSLRCPPARIRPGRMPSAASMKWCREHRVGACRGCRSSPSPRACLLRWHCG